MADKNLHTKFNDLTKPFLEDFYDSLFNKLEEKKVIEKASVKKAPDHFKLVTNPELQVEKIPVKNMKESLEQFREIVQKVYFNLRQPDSNRVGEFKLSTILKKLIALKALEAPWLEDKELVKIFDQMDQLPESETIQKKVTDLLKSNKINLTSLGNKILVFYGTYRSLNYFNQFGFARTTTSILRNIIAGTDLLLQRENNPEMKLYFEFKVRSTLIPRAEVILELVEKYNALSAGQKNASYFFLVVFVRSSHMEFGKARFNFDQLLSELRIDPLFRDRLIFTPVSIEYLHLIEDRYSEFKAEKIQKEIHKNFKNQPPPKMFLGRNDDFYDETFEIKEFDIDVKIIPRNTEFWRFGFRFSKTDIFPPIEEERHERTDIIDIHLCVGDLVSWGQGDTWNYPNRLYLTEYNGPPIKDDYSTYQNYDGSPVSIKFSSRGNDEFIFLVSVHDREIGSRIYNLKEFKYFKLFAWSDFNIFNLETTTIINYK